MKADHERVTKLLTDTVTLLCKNGLTYEQELRIQGLLGITVDNSEVFIVHINEGFSGGGSSLFPTSTGGETASSSSDLGPPPRKRPTPRPTDNDDPLVVVDLTRLAETPAVRPSANQSQRLGVPAGPPVSGAIRSRPPQPMERNQGVQHRSGGSMMPPRAAGAGSSGRGSGSGRPSLSLGVNMGHVMEGSAGTGNILPGMNRVPGGGGGRGGGGGYPDMSDNRRPGGGTQMGIVPHPMEYATMAALHQNSSRRDDPGGHQASAAMQQQQHIQHQQQLQHQIQQQQQQQTSQLLLQGRISQTKQMYQSQQGGGGQVHPFGPGGPGPQQGVVHHHHKMHPSSGSAGISQRGMTGSPGYANSAGSMMGMLPPGGAGGSFMDPPLGGMFAPPPPPRRQQRSPAATTSMLSPQSYLNTFPFAYPAMEGPGASASMMMMQGGPHVGASGNNNNSAMMTPQQWRPQHGGAQGNQMMLMPGTGPNQNQCVVPDYSGLLRANNFCDGGARGNTFPSFPSSIALSHLGALASDGANPGRDGPRVESPQLKKSPRVRPIIYDERIDLCDDVDAETSTAQEGNESQATTRGDENAGDPAAGNSHNNPPIPRVLNIQPESPEGGSHIVEGPGALAALEGTFGMSSDADQSQRYAASCNQSQGFDPDDPSSHGYDIGGQSQGYDVSGQSQGYDVAGQSQSFDDSMMMANIQEILPISCDDEFLGVSSGQECFDLGSLLNEDKEDGGDNTNSMTPVRRGSNDQQQPSQHSPEGSGAQIPNILSDSGRSTGSERMDADDPGLGHDENISAQMDGSMDSPPTKQRWKNAPTINLVKCSDSSSLPTPRETWVLTPKPITLRTVMCTSSFSRRLHQRVLSKNFGDSFTNPLASASKFKNNGLHLKILNKYRATNRCNRRALIARSTNISSRLCNDKLKQMRVEQQNE